MTHVHLHMPHKTTRDMTTGGILSQMLLFSVPLLLGNIFQLLYNTVDTLVVGNFVSTQALAAVGSTSMIVSVAIFFFNGLSIGAGVVISQTYGAKDYDALHRAVETTIAMTLIISAVVTVLGAVFVHPMLRFMSTPQDVIPDAAVYLRIYFAGISGLLIYNMASGILRAVGDSTRPLYFLILTSILNIALDLFFVLVLHMGIAGVAFATIISQFVSAVLVLALLTRTDGVHRFVWKDLQLHPGTFRRILTIGFPTAVQQTITSFSNVFVQSYINYFGSACMAGWSCYNKLIQFIFMPIQSMSIAATTFVSQNVGAGKDDRARRGTRDAVLMGAAMTVVVSFLLFLFAGPATRLFTEDADVIASSVRFIRVNVFFLLANCINHVLAGALRGRGDSRGPMFLMLAFFVVLRQTYLFVLTHYIANTEALVGLSYPVGWCTCCVAELIYYYVRHRKK